MNTVPIPQDTPASGALATLTAREADLLARLAQVQRVTLAQAEEGIARETTDFKEEADRAEHEQLADAQAARDHAELVEVRAALQRLQAGQQGVCADCEAAISPQRLQLVPWATRCTACQAAHEHPRL